LAPRTREAQRAGSVHERCPELARSQQAVVGDVAPAQLGGPPKHAGSRTRGAWLLYRRCGRPAEASASAARCGEAEAVLARRGASLTSDRGKRSHADRVARPFGHRFARSATPSIPALLAAHRRRRASSGCPELAICRCAAPDLEVTPFVVPPQLLPITGTARATWLHRRFAQPDHPRVGEPARRRFTPKRGGQPRKSAGARGIRGISASARNVASAWPALAYLPDEALTAWRRVAALSPFGGASGSLQLTSAGVLKGKRPVEAGVGPERAPP
jgi:hypothetical protein